MRVVRFVGLSVSIAVGTHCTGPASPVTAEVVEKVAPSAAVPSADVPPVDSATNPPRGPSLPASAGEPSATVTGGAGVRSEVLTSAGPADSEGWKRSLAASEPAMGTCLPKHGKSARGGSVTTDLAIDKAGQSTEPVLVTSSFDDKLVTECLRSELSRVRPEISPSHPANAGAITARVRVTLEPAR